MIGKGAYRLLLHIFVNQACSQLVFKGFGKAQYYIKHEMAEVEFFKHPFYNFSAALTNFNRTHKSACANFSLVEPPPPDTMVDYIAERFLSNEYRRTGIRFTIKLCDAFKTKMFGLDELSVNRSNPKMRCPLVPRVHYQIKDWVPDVSKFPNYNLYGRYRMNIIFFVFKQPSMKREEFGSILWYLELLEKVKQG